MLLAPLWLVLPTGRSFGQLYLPPPRGIFPSPNNVNRHDMTPTGKPHLAIAGSAKLQVINPHIYERWVDVTNSCRRSIKPKIGVVANLDCG